MSRHRDALRRGIRSLIHDTSRELADLEGREAPPEIAPPEAPGGTGPSRAVEVRPPVGAPSRPPDVTGPAAAPGADAAPAVEVPPADPVRTGTAPPGRGALSTAELPGGDTRLAGAPVEPPVHARNEPAEAKASATSEPPGGVALRQEPPRARETAAPPRPQAPLTRRPGASGGAATWVARSPERPPAVERPRAARGARSRRSARAAAPKERSRAGRIRRAGASTPVRRSTKTAGGRDRARPARRRAAAGIPMDGVDPQQVNARKGVCFAYFIKRECWRVPSAYCNTALQVCVMRDCPVYHLHREALERRFAGKYKHFW